jgi:hypothetical protein
LCVSFSEKNPFERESLFPPNSFIWQTAGPERGGGGSGPLKRGLNRVPTSGHKVSRLYKDVWRTLCILFLSLLEHLQIYLAHFFGSCGRYIFNIDDTRRMRQHYRDKNETLERQEGKGVTVAWLCTWRKETTTIVSSLKLSIPVRLQQALLSFHHRIKHALFLRESMREQNPFCDSAV